jgi:hypothetical protein
MSILKHLNWKYNSNLPYSLGDRYYVQDLVRDFRYVQDIVGGLASDVFGQTIPRKITGGVVTKGTGDTLNITSGRGWASFNVTIPDTFSAIPPSTTTSDVTAVPVVWTQQTNMAIASATLNGVATNYVKVRYTELNGNTRTRAKSSGTYSYETTDSYTFVVDTNAPTAYDLCLTTFVGTSGGAFSFSDPKISYPYWSDLSYLPVGTSLDWSGAHIPGFTGSVTLPNSFMIEDGASLLRASYSVLWDILQFSIPTIFTTTLSTNTVFNQTGHPFVSGDCISIVSTTGSLGTGLAIETKYYVYYLTTSTFKVSTTYSGAMAGTGLVGTTAGSGDITMRWNPFGIVDGTHFNLPDSRGLVTVGAGQQGTSDWAGVDYSERFGQYKQDRIQNITGTLSKVAINPSTGAATGALSIGSSSAESLIGSAGYGTRTLTFDASTSTNMRTGNTTTPARITKYKIIKVI